MSLFGALSSGVSALVAQSSSLGAIGDNIANVNTIGYKSTDVQFKTLVTKQVSSSKYSPGGVQAAPKSGVDVQGLLQSSTSSTDLAMSGQGFFIVNEQPQAGLGTLFAFTRAGSFSVDKSGYLQNTAGWYLQGWPLQPAGNSTTGYSTVEIGGDTYIKAYEDGSGVTQSINDNIVSTTDLQPINLNTIGGTAQETTAVRIGANLPATDIVGDQHKTNVVIYDTLGNSSNLEMLFEKESENSWGLSLDTPPGAATTEIHGNDTTDASPEDVYSASGLVSFNSLPNDGEYIIIDGITFEFDTDTVSSVTETATLRRIDISSTAIVSPSDVTPALKNAIDDSALRETSRFSSNGSDLKITQSVMGDDIEMDVSNTLSVQQVAANGGTGTYTIKEIDFAYKNGARVNFNSSTVSDYNNLDTIIHINADSTNTVTYTMHTPAQAATGAGNTFLLDNGKAVASATNNFTFSNTTTGPITATSLNPFVFSTPATTTVTAISLASLALADQGGAGTPDRITGPAGTFTGISVGATITTTGATDALNNVGPITVTSAASDGSWIQFADGDLGGAAGTDASTITITHNTNPATRRLTAAAGTFTGINNKSGVTLAGTTSTDNQTMTATSTTAGVASAFATTTTTNIVGGTTALVNDTLSITIAGTNLSGNAGATVTFTAVGGETPAQMAQGLVDAINLDADVNRVTASIDSVSGITLTTDFASDLLASGDVTGFIYTATGGGSLTTPAASTSGGVAGVAGSAVAQTFTITNVDQGDVFDLQFNPDNLALGAGGNVNLTDVVATSTDTATTIVGKLKVLFDAAGALTTAATFTDNGDGTYTITEKIDTTDNTFDAAASFTTTLGATNFAGNDGTDIGVSAVAGDGSWIEFNAALNGNTTDTDMTVTQTTDGIADRVTADAGTFSSWSDGEFATITGSTDNNITNIAFTVGAGGSYIEFPDGTLSGTNITETSGVEIANVTQANDVITAAVGTFSDYSVLDNITMSSANNPANNVSGQIINIAPDGSWIQLTTGTLLAGTVADDGVKITIDDTTTIKRVDISGASDGADVATLLANKIKASDQINTPERFTADGSSLVFEQSSIGDKTSFVINSTTADTPTGGRVTGSNPTGALVTGIYKDTSTNTTASMVDAGVNLVDTSTYGSKVSSINFAGDGLPSDFNVSNIDIQWANGSTDQEYQSSLEDARIGLFLGDANVNNGMTQFAGSYQINFITQNGAQFGNFAGVSVGSDGIVTALFDNGVTRPVFMVPVATFVNPNAMESLSGNVYIETDFSGSATVREAGSGGAGDVTGAALESSTVDLGEEFTAMIVTQRAYSAAAKIITTADEMLDELLRIK